MVTKFFRNSNFSDFLGIRSGISQCGVNANHKEFFADQSANKCYYLNPGAIEGVFAMSKYTWTALLGQKEDSVFYEVYDGVDGSVKICRTILVARSVRFYQFGMLHFAPFEV